VIEWFNNDAALRLWLSDLLRADFLRLRRGMVEAPFAPWANSLEMGERGLGADSIERVELASTLFQAINAEASGELDDARMDVHFGSWLALAQRSLTRHSTTLTFFTSGSSAAPQAISHLAADLSHEVEWFARHLFGSRKRILLAVPSQHIYGFLFGVLLPTKLNCTTLSLTTQPPQAALALAQPGDLIVAQPLWWDQALRGQARFAQDVLGLTSTMRAPDALFAHLRERGLAGLIDIYGSTETGGIGWREAAGAYRLLDWLTQVPNNAPDQIEMLDARTFVLGARADRVVQVAGVNVSLDQVERVLARFAGVETARVRLSQSEPRRLKALLVGTLVDSTRTRSALETHALESLDAAARPRHLSFARHLPRNEHGKECDWNEV